MFKKVLLSSLLLLAGLASAQEQVVNLYSARHYQTDEKLYSDFTKATGIKAVSYTHLTLPTNREV